MANEGVTCISMTKFSFWVKFDPHLHCTLNVYLGVSCRKPEHIYIQIKSTNSLNPRTNITAMFHCPQWDSIEHVQCLDRFVIQKILDICDNWKTILQPGRGGTRGHTGGTRGRDSVEREGEERHKGGRKDGEGNMEGEKRERREKGVENFRSMLLEILFPKYFYC